MGNNETITDATDVVSTKYAAEQVGVSETYFRLLAAYAPAIMPKRLPGSRVVLWTPAQVQRVGERRKT